MILAGVAIGTLDQSNIIGKAQSAADLYQEKKVEENTLIADAEEWLRGNTTTYADFWKAAYEKIGAETYVSISNHIYIGFGKYEGKVVGQLLYGDCSEDDWIESRYLMTMNSGSDNNVEIKANQWYTCTEGSHIDFSTALPLPEEILTNKSGTPFSGYEELCKLFDEAIGTEGCEPYIANAN